MTTKTEKGKSFAANKTSETSAANTTSANNASATSGAFAVNENTCNVEKTEQAISELYKNVTMAQNCVKTLLPYVQEGEVTKSLHQQVEQYDKYIEQIGTVGKNLNFDPSPAPKALVAMANMGIRTKMMLDKSTTHVAKLMLQGTLNGIIDLYRLMKEQDIHPDVALLQKQVLRYEEGRFEDIKRWL